jgi:cystathionine beta-lyase
MKSKVLVNNNDRVLVENPLRLNNGRLCMDFDDLKEKSFGAKMIILSHPHNPGGSVWTREELTRLGEISLENNLMILSDEIHSDLVFPEYRHVPLATLSNEIAQRTITCNAPSKTFNLAGLSTSYLIIPNENLRQTYNHILNDQLHLNMGNLFGSIALKAAYNMGDEWLKQLLDYVWKNVEFVMDFCEKHLPKIKVIKPESTYMIWLDCRETGLSGNELKDFFVQKAGVGLNEGIQFGTGGEGFMRMNVACPKATVEKALMQIREAFEK